MRPKGWRLDPAWVEHYSKIERERLEREIQRMKMEAQLRQMEADHKAIDEYHQSPVWRWETGKMTIPEAVKEFWRGDGWKG